VCRREECGPVRGLAKTGQSSNNLASNHEVKGVKQRLDPRSRLQTVRGVRTVSDKLVLVSEQVNKHEDTGDRGTQVHVAFYTFHPGTGLSGTLLCARPRRPAFIPTLNFLLSVGRRPDISSIPRTQRPNLHQHELGQIFTHTLVVDVVGRGACNMVFCAGVTDYP